jgi:DNA-directed RNA polymerase subunit N (RpoN/RPB10)
MHAIRCFSCNKVIGNLWLKWEERVKAGEDKAVIMDSMGLKRYCCRRMLLTNPDAMGLVAEFGDRHTPAGAGDDLDPAMADLAL